MAGKPGHLIYTLDEYLFHRRIEAIKEALTLAQAVSDDTSISSPAWHWYQR
jgi:hypothetical protein